MYSGIMEALLIKNYLQSGLTPEEIAEATGLDRTVIDIIVDECTKGGELAPVVKAEDSLLEKAKETELTKQMALAPAYAMVEAKLLHKIYQAADEILPESPYAAQTLEKLAKAMRTLDRNAAAENLANENVAAAQGFTFQIMNVVQGDGQLQ